MSFLQGSSRPLRSRLTWPRGVFGSPWRVAAIVFLAAVIADSVLPRVFDVSAAQGWLGVVVIVGVTAAFLVHPRFREGAIGVVAALLFVSTASLELRSSIEAMVPTAYATYLASAWSRPSWRRVWLPLLLVGVALVDLLAVRGVVTGGLPVTVGTVETQPLPTAIAFIGSSWLGVGFFWLLGVQKRRRVEGMELLRERAEMAGVIERTRIAREMHDIIAHNLSGIIALADGARFAAAKDPKVATEALETISAQGRSSLQQMRGLLSVLRDESTRELTAAPGAKEMAQLVAEARRSGLDVEVTGLDEVPSEAPELVQFTCYRVLQELLTNMLRYSPTKAGRITISGASGRIVLRSENPMAAGTGAGQQGAGYGLRGVRERAQAHGGRMQQAIENGNFVVEVEIPA